MDMLAEIVSLLGPPNSSELEQMNIGYNGCDEENDENNDNCDTECSTLIELMLSIRTFKTFEERLREKLERTCSGRFDISSEIVDIIMDSLQYVAKDRKMSVPIFESE